MARRPSVPNIYENSPRAKAIPPYQSDIFPMRNGHAQPSQLIPRGLQNRAPSVAYNSSSFKTNRIGPSPPQHPQANLLNRTSRMYPQIDTRYSNNPNQLFHSQYSIDENDYPYADIGQSEKPPSWLSKKLCFGLTRLSGGILFGTMAILAAVAIGGLITSIILYTNDAQDQAQWKILGMVVSAVLLLTVLVTLFIFIYCYKKGHIILNNNENNFLTPQDDQLNSSRKPSNYNHDTNFRRPDHYYDQPYNQGQIPYGMMDSRSPSSTYENMIPVQDKQTNTEQTIAALRLRDAKRGVWPVMNAYGGMSYRPVEPPQVNHRFAQVLPHEIDQSIAQKRNQSNNRMPLNNTRQPPTRTDYSGDQRSSYFITPQPSYEMIEETYKVPRKRKPEEYVESIELSKQKQLATSLPKAKYGDVSVKHVKPAEESNIDEDKFNTDHFYV
ncbi:unnamed protein product [Adineta steineri]|uniref:Uncharacterized protein n=1 Tax=Adineta steineri TaxID=433720 RepID=A0A814NBV0_9BILA|nr:unnamed protein product [Adineta steineri]